jgi:hypothetical protein
MLLLLHTREVIGSIPVTPISSDVASRPWNDALGGSSMRWLPGPLHGTTFGLSSSSARRRGSIRRRTNFPTSTLPFLIERIVQLARRRAQDQDTWHGYRFFERWADIGRALRARGELFGELKDDVTQRFGLVEPVDRGEIFRRPDARLAHDLA